jgi:predicted small secreted protein
MGPMNKMLIWLMFAVIAIGVNGCHTMVGVGQDLQGAGHSLSEWDKDSKAAAAQRKTYSKDNPYR